MTYFIASLPRQDVLKAVKQKYLFFKSILYLLPTYGMF